MLSIDEIVAALKTTRTEFARLYLQAQTEAQATTRTAFEAVGLDPDAKQAFRTALLEAQVKGWLLDFLYLVVADSMENGAIAQYLIDENAKGNAELQAMTNRLRGFGQPDLLYRGVADAIRWTAKVVVNGVPKGTGFLIQPNLLLTAWHVLSTAFKANGGGQWDPDPTAGQLMTFEFDDVQRYVGRNRVLQHQGSLTAKAAQDWHVRSSPCHKDELTNKLPVNRQELDGYWDYVIVRLQKTLGLERRWGRLDERAVIPNAKRRIMVLQHAGGQPLRYDESEIGGPVDFDPPDGRYPDIRFIHFANTLGGSSGGPCFDSAFSVFGMHQGEWPTGASNGRVANRGAPITRILKDIKARGDLPQPDPNEIPIWQLGKEQANAPVLGTEEFQRVLWSSALTDKPRIVLIAGQEQSGKSFLLDVLKEMLRDPQHLKIEIPAEAIAKADTPTFVTQISQLGGVTPPPLASEDNVNSTTAVYRKDEVMAGLVSTLDLARRGRKVWILIRDLNKTDITGPDARELLLLLYAQVLKSDWLRIVLDGFQSDMPAELKRTTDTVLADIITADDVGRYFKRLSAEYDLNIADKIAEAHGNVMAKKYTLLAAGVKRTRVRDLAEEIVTYAEQYLA